MMTTTFYLTSVYGATVIVFMSLGFSSNTKVMGLIPGESGIQCSCCKINLFKMKQDFSREKFVMITCQMTNYFILQ